MEEEKRVARQAPLSERQRRAAGIEDNPDLPVLTRDDILTCDDRRLERVDMTPFWAGCVFVRVLSGEESDAFEQACYNARQGKHMNLKGLKALLLSKTVTDASGQLLFTPADIKALNQKSRAALDRLFQRAQAVNGMTDEQVEELAGNSLSDRSDEDGFDSQPD